MWILALLPAVVLAQAPQEIVRLLRLTDSVTNVRAQKNPEDLYDKGIAEIEDTAVLVGTRNRRANVSTFCGELASFHLKNADENRHDALIYRPQLPMNGATGLMVLAIPHLWFREGSETYAAPNEFSLFVCLGDTSRLGISTIKVTKDRLIRKDGYFLFVHRFAPSTGLMIRSAALILDQKWNNVFLLPKNSFSALVVQTMDVKVRKLFTGICDVTKGMNQECCRWPFYQVQRNGRRVRYHRCIGEIAPEDINIPVSRNLTALLMKGGMTRRFITPPSKVCRENRFKSVKVFPTYDHMEVGEMLTRKLHRLDAVECAIYY